MAVPGSLKFNIAVLLDLLAEFLRPDLALTISEESVDNSNGIIKSVCVHVGTDVVDS